MDLSWVSPVCDLLTERLEDLIFLCQLPATSQNLTLAAHGLEALFLL
jgi:hypothetical protein